MKEARRWVYKHLVWILIITALLFIGISLSNLIKDESWNELFENIGLTILSSGVFLAVLKSLQFTGLFKEEIEKVILGTEFIKNRNDLPDLWRDISKVIYKSKFPQISLDLENRILTTYFPTNNEYYYEDYVVTINIDEITDDFIIHYTQTCKYNVVLEKGIEGTTLNLTSSIDVDAMVPEIVNELEFFKINGEDYEASEDQSTMEKPEQKKFIIPLSGENEYKIHSKFRRRYSLRNENYKLFRLVTFVKNMDVVISYPENVSVSFFNIGNVTKFEKLHVEISNQIHRSHRNDILLPHQGFGLSFEKDGS